MAKLIFRYGAMGSSKSANALMTRYNYIEKGKNALLLKPLCENRDGQNIIRSRIGLKAECEFAEEFLNDYDIGRIKSLDAVIVDEVQFLSSNMIDKLSNIVDDFDIPVICYGLRTDFRQELFAGSKRLMEIADAIEEIPTICWCGKKANFNARISDGIMVTEGEQVQLGGNESYTALCRKHYKERKINF